MQFRTSFQIGKNDNFLINHHSKILTIGSCFSDVLGAQLLDYKFDTIGNPFGNVYNPISIFDLLQSKSKNLIIENDNKWYSLAHHSAIHADSYNGLEAKLTALHAKIESFLSTCNYVVITLGSAYAYKHKESNKFVANCHKLPATLFEKQLLSLDNIMDSFEMLHNYLININPKIKIIFTVSPVRHIKDTMELNSVSKSILRLACHYFTANYANVSYFPSYEILLDDLRDYRFYKADMIHPTEVATDYIWKKWADSYFDIPTKGFIIEWQSILSDLNHKPFDSNSVQYHKFVSNTLDKIKRFASTVDVNNEINFLQSKLA